MAATIKNWNRKTIAVVLAVMMVVSVFAGTSFFALIKAEERLVTVGEFYHELIEAMNYENADYEYPEDYYADISPEHEYYNDIMIATSYGMIFTDSNQVVNADGTMVRERAAQVVNYCLGFQTDELPENVEDYTSIINNNDVQVAIERGWFDLVDGRFEPQKPITVKELKRITDDVQTVNDESLEFADNVANKYSIAKDVIIVPDDINVEWNAIDDSFILSEEVEGLEPGVAMAIIIDDVPQVFSIGSIDYLDDGKVYIETSDNITEEKVDDLVINGTNAIDPRQLIPAEGVTIGQSSSGKNGPRKIRGNGSIPLNLDSKSVPLFQSEGVKCTLSMVPTDWKINYSLESTSSRQYAYAVIEGDLQIKFDLSADWVDAHFYENEIEIARYPVWGFGFVGIFAVLDFKGDLTTQYTAHLQTGFEYKDESTTLPEFRLIHSCQKKSWSLDANAEAGIGLKVAAGVDAFGYRGDLFATLGAQVYAKAHLGDDSSVGSCISFASWMSLDIGAELVKKHTKATESDKVLNKKEMKVFDVTNSPIRLNYHMEDGRQVATCTRGYNTAISVDEIKNSSTTPINNEIKDKEFNIEPEDSYIKMLSSSDLDYSIKNGKATVKKLKNKQLNYHDIALPSSIDGYPVTSIAGSAFEGSNVASVIIPKSIVNISNKAFFNCRLTRITILGTDVNIGSDAFSYRLENGITQADMICELYCFDNSTAKKYANSTKGFEYHSLAWDGETVWPVEEINNEYHVHTCFELAYLRDYVNYGHPMEGKTIVLENDIDLNNQLWIPIGTSSDVPFSGSIAGNGNTINGLNVNTKLQSQTALLGYVNSNKISISDITIRGKNLNAGTAGGLIGVLELPEAAEATISQCRIDMTTTTWAAYGGNSSGGIIGEVKGASTAKIEISRCATTGRTEANSRYQSADNFSGGLIGVAKKGIYTIKECALGGTVYANAGGFSVGGIIGVFAPDQFTIDNCLVCARIQCVGIGAGRPLASGMIANMQYDNVDDESSCVINNSYVSSVITGAFNAMFVNRLGDYSSIPIAINNTYFDGGKTTVDKGDLVVNRGYFGKNKVVSDKWVNSGVQASVLLKDSDTLYEAWDTDKIWEYSKGDYPHLSAFPDIKPCSNHQYTSARTDPTCTSQGYTTYTCAKCGYAYNAEYVNAKGHSYVFTKTVDPTCTTQGYDLYTCTVCNATERRNYVKATGHTIPSYDRTVAPTCTTQGYDEGVCTVCGQTVKENYVKATGHTNETIEVVEPTCQDKGYTLLRCSTCGVETKANYVDATGHDYTVTHTTAASCTESGLDTYVCKNCGDTYTKDVSALGHNYTWVSNTHIAPTCTEKGYTVQTCSRCGETQTTNELQATGHDYGALSGKAYIETIYDSNNRFVDSLSYTPNTVTKNTVGSTAIGNNGLLNAGWMTLPREIRLDENNLDVIEDYYIARQRHLLSFSAQVEIPAAFVYKTSTGRAPEYSAIPYTDDKGNLYALEGEGVVFSLTRAEAEEKGILNGDGTVNVPEALKQGYIFAYSAGLPGTYISLPEFEFISGFSGWNTPTQVFHYDGKGAANPGVYTVNYCFYNEHQSGTTGTTIKVYDYAALNKTSPAKNGSPATVQHKCIDCGEVTTEELGFDEALKLKSSSLSLGNNLIMNFKVSKDALGGYEAPYLEVTRNGKVTTLREYAEQGDNYVFSFTNIAPQTMNDEMTAVLYATKEGKLYASTEVKTSVKKYLYNILNAYSADKYAKLRTLLVDLLNYGATAQKYTNYKTDSLVIVDLTAEQKQWASSSDLEFNNITNAAYETVDNPSANWKSASLILDNAVTVRYKFTAENLEGLSLRVQYGKNEKVLDSSSFEALGDGVYSVKFNGLSAHQLKETLYATFYKDGEAVSNTLAYSVESYAAQVRDNNPESTLDDLMSSLMRYGNSAVNYKKG